MFKSEAKISDKVTFVVVVQFILDFSSVLEMAAVEMTAVLWIHWN